MGSELSALVFTPISADGLKKVRQYPFNEDTFMCLSSDTRPIRIHSVHRESEEFEAAWCGS